jgi:predicted ATPase
MVKNNFFIITGGPGGGKTSVLQCLLSQGFNYIEETARQIIKERLLNRLSPRPEPKVFSTEMFTKDFDNYISNAIHSSTLFFDRSFVDSALLLFQSDEKIYDRINEILKANRYNKKVFIVPPWEEIYCQDNERDQTFEQAVTVYDQLYHWYKANDYDLVILPKDTIENRAKFIMTEIQSSVVKS